MEKTKRLYLYGIGLLAIALCNVVMLVIGFIAGDYSTITHEDAIIQALTNAIIIAVLVCNILSIIVCTYLGLKGMAEAKEASGGSAHIVIAKILGVINLILTVIMGLSLLTGSNVGDDYFTFGICFAETFIMFEYARTAKAVRDEGEED